MNLVNAIKNKLFRGTAATNENARQFQTELAGPKEPSNISPAGIFPSNTKGPGTIDAWCGPCPTENIEHMKGEPMEPKAISEYPKMVTMNRPLFEIQLGTRPLYHLELIHTRTRETKMFMSYLENETLKAPRGYRIARLWKGTVSAETEISITA